MIIRFGKSFLLSIRFGLIKIRAQISGDYYCTLFPCCHSLSQRNLERKTANRMLSNECVYPKFNDLLLSRRIIHGFWETSHFEGWLYLHLLPCPVLFCFHTFRRAFSLTDKFSVQSGLKNLLPSRQRE